METTLNIPDPVYVRCTAPYMAFDARATLGPYRVVIRTERVGGVFPPVAVPPDLGDALVASGEFEHVDAAAALPEIADADRASDAEAALWREQLDNVRVENERLKGIRSLIVGRERAEIAAYKTHKTKGRPDHEAVVEARTAGDQFAADVAALAPKADG